MNPGREQPQCRKAAGARRRGLRRPAALAAACVAALIGCGDDDKAEKKPSPFSAITTAPAPDNKPKHAAPRWEPLERFTGSGREVRQLDVSPKAIQWRARWRCRTGRIRLSVEPPPADGKPLEDKRCPGRGEAVSVHTGKQRLEVKASGPWRVTIEQQVDTPLIEPAPATLASARLLGTAKVYNVDREGQGTAKLYELPDGSRLIRLEDFFVSINSDLELRLSELPNPRSTDEVVKAPWKLVAPLKATVGNMNYEVPRDVDVSQFNSIVIWCEITRNAYAAAAIER